MRALLLLCFVCSVFCAAANGDSLQNVLRGLPNDTARLPVLTELLRATVFNKPDSGLYYAEQYISIAEQARIPLEIGKGHNYAGMCYTVKGDHDQALAEYLVALENFLNGTDPWYTAMAHNNVGSVHEVEQHWPKATEEYRRAYVLFAELGDTVWMANVSNNLGNILYQHNELDSAIVHYERADVLLTRAGQWSTASSTRMNLANTYERAGDQQRALTTMRGALAIHPVGEDESTRGNILVALGRLQGLGGDQDSALLNMREGIRLAKAVGATSVLASGHGYMAEYFESIGRPDSALAHFKQMTAFQDSLFSEEKSAQIAEMQEKYESGRKDLLIAENAAMLARRSDTIKIVVAGALLLLIAALMAFRAYRLKRTKEAELEKKNAIIEVQLKEKELLLREIHHRVKNNLQTVSSLLSIQSRGITDERAKQAVNDGRLRVKSMALIHQDLYREGDLTGVRMKEYVEKLAKGLITSYAMADRVELRCEVQALDLDVDSAVPIGLILNELITNALKYAWPDGRNGLLTITMRTETDALIVHVRDNGIGYDPSVRSAEGSGFGLNMINTFASKLKAEWSIGNNNGTVVELIVRNFKLAH